jgi:hypothetical protein
MDCLDGWVATGWPVAGRMRSAGGSHARIRGAGQAIAASPVAVSATSGSSLPRSTRP